MNILARMLTASAVVGLSLSAANPGHAELTSRIQYIDLTVAPAAGYNTTQIEVAHDGTDWVKPSPDEATVQYNLSVEAKTTKNKYKITQALAGGEFEYGDFGKLKYWPESQVLNVKTSGEPELGPKDFPYDYAVGVGRPVNACKALYDELHAQGLTHDEVLGEDRLTSMPLKLGIAVKAHYKNEPHTPDWNNPLESAETEHPNGYFVRVGHWGIKEIWSTISVKCLKTIGTSEIQEPPPVPPRPGADHLILPFEITKIELSLGPKVHEGVCPVEITLKIDVFASSAGIAKVIAKTAGTQTPVIDVSVVMHPSGAFVGTASIKAMVGQSAEGGFVATPDTGGGPSTDIVVETQENVHQGIYWVEAANGVKSDDEGYKVTCVPAPFEPGVTAADPVAKPTRNDPPGAKTAGKARLKVKAVRQGAPSALANAAAAPDLTIKSVRPMSGDTALRVLVRNAGTAAAGPSNLKLTVLIRGRTKTKGAAVRPIAPGGQQWVQVDAGAPLSRAERVTLSIDDPNRIKEIDERNNGFSVR